VALILTLTFSFVFYRDYIQKWKLINVQERWWQVVCLCAVKVYLHSWLQECTARQRNVILGSTRRILIGILLLTLCNLLYLTFNPINQNSDLKTVTVYCHSLNNFFYLAQQPPLGQDLLIIEDLWSCSFRHSTVGRTPLHEWSARRRGLYLTTHNTHDRHPCPSGIRTHNISKRQAADPRLRPHGHWSAICCSIQVHELALN
jgi:hypothetical protein